MSAKQKVSSGEKEGAEVAKPGSVAGRHSVKVNFEERNATTPD